jgi:hypothetical protein
MYKRSRRFGIVWVLVLSVLVSNELFAQLNCTPGVPLPEDYFSNQDLYRGEGVWIGAVFQLSSSFVPGIRVNGVLNDTNFDFGGNSNGNRQFKGFLQRNEAFVPISSGEGSFASGLNFYTHFMDPLVAQSGADEGSFFPTSSTREGSNSDGCQVEHQFFGVIMRSKVTIPEGGIYQIQVGSDDGSYLRVRSNGQPILLLGTEREMEHINYFKTSNMESPFFDGLNNFVYSENIRSYLVEFNGGEEVWFDLTYYEMRGKSELSFNFQKYQGGGEIKVRGSRRNIVSYCSANPNPAPFDGIFAPAVSSNGVLTAYQWQYSLTAGSTANWVKIPGATSWDYDIPPFNIDTDKWTGIRYFRRVAQDQVLQPDGSLQTVLFVSNVIGIERNTIGAEFDENEFGNNEWIGHIYRNIRNFNTNDYLGQHVEPVHFSQNFGGGDRPQFTPNQFGCTFEAEFFTVRYKMVYSFKKDTDYTFNLRSDDGSRLFVGGDLLIDAWAGSTGSVISSSPVFTVDEDKDIELVLDYFERTGQQLISFSITEVFNPYVVEWGAISGQPCGTQNCLSWETVRELNNREFIVERSYDGATWSPISDPIPGRANSNQSRLYSFTDDSFLAVGAFYRIKRVTIDDAIAYSETVRIENETFGSRLIPYPNPTTDKLRFYAPGGLRSVRITNTSGALNEDLPFASLGQHIYEIDLSIFPGNVYVITVTSEDSSQRHKVIKR